MNQIRRLLTGGFQYELVEGDGDQENDFFKINEDQLIIKKELNWNKNFFGIRVKTTDGGGLSFQKPITIDIRFRNSPPYQIDLSKNQIEENEAEGSLIGYLSTKDNDQNDLHTYALVDYTNFPDNFHFQIFRNQLRTLHSFDFE